MSAEPRLPLALPWGDLCSDPTPWMLEAREFPREGTQQSQHSKWTFCSREESIF